MESPHSCDAEAPAVRNRDTSPLIIQYLKWSLEELQSAPVEMHLMVTGKLTEYRVSHASYVA